MRTLMTFLIGLVILASCNQSKNTTETGQEVDTLSTTEPDFFEMRTYYCNPGKLEALLSRFRNHTTALFEKHGMTNVAYWVPQDNQENKLVYLMAYESKAHRDKCWEGFMNDPDWNAVWAESKKDGALVDSIVSRFYHYTFYSPKLKAEDNGPRIFSHRTYYTNQGKLPALHDRFADHTMEIFENNGMTNVAYFQLDTIHDQSDEVLTYFISFPDTTARAKAWEAFGNDPAWQKAYQASISDGGLVKSITDETLIAVDFSPLK